MKTALDAAFARVWTLNDEEKVLELRASAGMYTHTDGTHARVPVGKFKIGLIAEERRPHLTNDVLGDPRVTDKEWVRREGMEAFAGHPLLVEDRLVGVVAAFAREPLAEDAVEALASLADTIAQGIERARAEEALRRSESDLAAAQKLAHVGSWAADVEKGGLHWSDELYRIYGFAPRQFAPTPEKLLEIVHPEDRGLVEGSLREALDGAEQAAVECRIVRPDGGVRFVQNHGRAELDEGGRPFKLSGTVQDITERKVLEEELAHRASHDGLTGLPNRGLFMDHLERALARAQRYEGQVAVLFLDLDDFKSVNDSLGHGAGDRLLVAVADRLRSCLRPEDTAARFGGDEFAVLLEGVEGADEAARVARRIAEELDAPFALDGRELSASASIGIALGHPGRSRPEDLLREADLAMYRAKAADGVRYEIFRPEREG